MEHAKKHGIIKFDKLYMEAQSVPEVCKLILVRLIDSMLGKIFKVF